MSGPTEVYHEPLNLSDHNLTWLTHSEEWVAMLPPEKCVSSDLKVHCPYCGACQILEDGGRCYACDGEMEVKA